jgi:membrane-bound metal-dependent hydrolase YbcI (DUF457 family)
MKGIAHFVTGVAIATFFPEVVERAAEGSILPVLGGVAAILPDTLDFRFVRYFERYDLEIDPGPEPDPGRIAEELADAMRRAYETGEPERVMLHTIRLGPDRWRRYVVRFDPPEQEVAVQVGPIVDTGQMPLFDSEPCDGEEVCIDVGVPMVRTYDEEILVDIFSGPSFTFERRGDRVYVRFLDWHRRWSHSLTLAAVLSLAIAGVAALVERATGTGITRTPLWLALVTGLGFLGHVLGDQLGFMGSNLFYPFTRRRTKGLKLIHSGDGMPNFLTVWTALMLILFNLDRFSVQPMLDPGWLFLGLTVAVPGILLGGVYRRRRGRETRDVETLRQQEIMSEVEETVME